MKTCVIAIALLLLPIAVLKADDDDARSPQLVQEVFQSELVYPQDKGEVQLTIAPELSNADEGNTRVLPLRVEYGITNAWQLEAQIETLNGLRTDRGERASGLGDVEIGTKYSFMNIGGSRLHAAVGAGLTLPTGNPNRGLGDGLTQFEPFVAVGRDLPNLGNAHLFGHVALDLVRRTRGESDTAPAHELSVNGGIIVPLQNVRLVGELNSSTNRWNHGGQESALYFTPGVVWHLPARWEAGIGVPIGLNNGADRYRVIAQLIWEFGGDGD